MYKVMISYFWDNDAHREALRTNLRDIDNLEILCDTERIRLGEHVHPEISRMIGEADCLIVLLTKEGIASKEVIEEIIRADEQKKAIIPILGSDVSADELPFFLQDISRIIYTPKNFDSVIDKLRAEITKQILLKEQKKDSDSINLIKSINKKDFPTITSEEEKRIRPIISIGSGNIELVIQTEGSFNYGDKLVTNVNTRFGGSGINFAMRLLSQGLPTIPLVTIGSDNQGHRIKDTLLRQAKKADVPSVIREIIDCDEYLHPKIKTPTTLIIVSNGQRTIFSQKLVFDSGYSRELISRLDKIDALFPNKPAAVILGHIHTDSISDENGKLTRHVIQRYSESSFIYTVLGKSQLERGYNKWKDEGLFEGIDIFQLNLGEAKAFFTLDGKFGGPHQELETILTHINKVGISTIFTMDHFGAIASYKDDPRIFIARPILPKEKVVDSTGAGDAFAAGMLSSIDRGNYNFTFRDFEQGLNEGLVWAASACQTLGGCDENPDVSLQNFWSQNIEFERKKFKIEEKISHLSVLMDWIDLEYQ